MEKLKTPDDCEKKTENRNNNNKNVTNGINKIKTKNESAIRGFLQAFAAAYYVNFFMYMPIVSSVFTIFLFIYFGLIVRTLLVIYFVYIYISHKRNASIIYGNGPMFFRDNTLTDLAREYYPVNLVKTAELPPNRNYLIGSFPHGIIGTGLTTNMSINIRPWMQMFPGIRPKVVTLDFYFLIPFLRELRCWGMIPSSKTALLQVLGRSNDSKHPHNSDGFTSNAVGLVVGGAQEALDSKPGQYILTLKERKGFVKIAIQAGSPIVPSFSFGEVDILNQAENGPDSKLRTFQTLFKRIVGFSPVIVSGRGLGQSFGVVPFRKPIVQVIGAPIDVKKMINPDPKYVDEIHQKFIDGVHEIFEKYKFDYLENPECAKLVIN